MLYNDIRILLLENKIPEALLKLAEEIDDLKSQLNGFGDSS